MQIAVDPQNGVRLCRPMQVAVDPHSIIRTAYPASLGQTISRLLNPHVCFIGYYSSSSNQLCSSNSYRSTFGTGVQPDECQCATIINVEQVFKLMKVNVVNVLP